MFKFIDDFFCEIEKKAEKSTKKTRNKKPGSLGAMIRNIFLNKTGLNGWKDDKDKFRIELVNDIKTFLFSKWEKPWKAGLVFDAKGFVLSGFRNISGRLYKNHINLLSMADKSSESPYFITTGALRKQGGKITDKNKIVSVLSYIPMFKDKNSSKRKPDWFAPKLHQAINVAFCDGIKKPEIREIQFQDHELNEYVESFLNELIKQKRVPKIYTDQADRCFYRPGQDAIHMVNFKQFHQIEEYYSTLLHEITHSTGNPARLGRGQLNKARSLSYANEELVAEMGAMILCTELGLRYNRQNAISYLKGWLQNAKGDVDNNLIEAYSFACDAAEYLLKDIDLSKLIPKSMQDRAKIDPSPKQVIAKDKKDSVPVRKKRAYFGTQKPTAQLALFGEKTKTETLGFTPIGKVKKGRQLSLPGDIGAFLGGYERLNYSIVLRGDKGAGKSRLLYQLINVFAAKRYSVGFLSLEMSPQSSISNRYTQEYIDKKNLKQVNITGDSLGFDQLNSICKLFDVVAIDSWTKLKGIEQEDFDRLQKSNPTTIFLVIFQSTTAKVARGGNMPEYDASTVIQVNEGGIAECEKNRFASTNKKYSVFEKCLLVEDDI